MRRSAAIADRHLDTQRAIASFLQNHAGLLNLPLISDAEMLQLFGPEVTAALAELERFNFENQICQNCGGSCCKLVSCELYTPGLKSCPVRAMRPVLCRLHFCTRFRQTYPVLVKECGDIYLDSLIAAQEAGSRNVPLFDTPPLKKIAPQIVTSVSSILAEFGADRLDAAGTLTRITALLEKR